MTRLGIRGRPGSKGKSSTGGEAHAARSAPDLARSATSTPDYIGRNRAAWDRWSPDLAGHGRRDWAGKELRWGLWSTSESALGLVADLKSGSDVLELGCGTAGVSAWIARLGLRPVAVDFSRRQLETASQLQSEFGLTFPLVHADAENVPYDLESFDLAVSEYGASLWCDPRRWLPEAHRLLRPGGRLIFVANTALLMACTPPEGGVAGVRLARPLFGSDRFEFPDGTVEFHLTHGRWIKTLRAAGFEIEELIEVRPPPSATPRYEFTSVEWARSWPSEEIWVVRKSR